jgi:hypothetical protein
VKRNRDLWKKERKSPLLWVTNTVGRDFGQLIEGLEKIFGDF